MDGTAKGDVVRVIVWGEHMEMDGKCVVRAKDEERVLFEDAQFV